MKFFQVILFCVAKLGFYFQIMSKLFFCDMERCNFLVIFFFIIAHTFIVGMLQEVDSQNKLFLKLISDTFFNPN